MGKTKPSLSLVVPMYQETYQQIDRMYRSVKQQIGINTEYDFELIIVLDCDKKISHISEDLKCLSSVYDLPYKLVEMSVNVGSGIARQTGMNEATMKYIMFMDADDELHNCFVFHNLINELENTKADMITSKFVEELAVEGSENLAYIPHEHDMTWFHGKMFRRFFLVENDINFHNDLRVHEDSYFLSLCGALSDNIKHFPDFTYVWHWSENTITRKKDGLYRFSEMPTFIQSIADSIKELERYGELEKLPIKTAQLMIYIYFSICSMDWLTEEKQVYRNNAIQALNFHVRPLLKYFMMVNTEQMCTLYREEREKHFSNQIEWITFNDFIRSVWKEDDASEPEEETESEID